MRSIKGSRRCSAMFLRVLEISKIRSRRIPFIYEGFRTRSQQTLEQSEQKVNQLITILTTHVSTLINSNNTSRSGDVVLYDSAQPTKLPQIAISTFSGKYSDWIPFKERFQSSIMKHPRLSKVHQADYLKSALSGGALSVT